MSNNSTASIILASSSKSRRLMLENAGLEFEIAPPRVDEEEVKHSLQAAGASAADTAQALAELKALRISKDFPEHFVIGADQMLECGTIWFDKPADLDHARAHLSAPSRENPYIAKCRLCRQRKYDYLAPRKRSTACHAEL